MEQSRSPVRTIPSTPESVQSTRRKLEDTPETVERVRSMLASGVTICKITAELGCRRTEVTSLVKKHGLLKRSEILLSTETADKVAELLNNGHSVPHIADILACCPATVHSIILKYNLPYHKVARPRYQFRDEDSVSRVRDLLDIKAPIRQIARELGTSPNTVRSVIRDFNLTVLERKVGGRPRQVLVK